MASVTNVRLVDDLDRESEATVTVPFSLDGVDLLIDLSEEHAQALRDVLAPYVAAGRKAGAAGGRHRAPSGLRRNSTAIREWLTQHGHVVPARGRLSPVCLLRTSSAKTQAHRLWTKLWTNLILDSPILTKPR